MLRVFAERRAARLQCLPLPALLLGLALGAVAGCASSPRPQASDAAQEVPAELLAAYRRALAELKGGQLESARRALEALREQRPDLPGPAVNLAIIERLGGDPERAMALLDAVLQNTPGFAPAYHQRALLLREQGRFLPADEAYAQALERDPDYALAHFNRAVLNDLYLARPEVALQHFTIYQSLQAEEDERVARWIVELTRRVNRNPVGAVR